jgi:hypothetical protein
MADSGTLVHRSEERGASGELREGCVEARAARTRTRTPCIKSARQLQ